jgi:hypothetical protein
MHVLLKDIDEATATELAGKTVYAEFDGKRVS